MVLPLKTDQGKCVILVLNCRRKAMVWFDWGEGNTSFWEGLVMVYGDGILFSSNQVAM
jgi:hypothetical protein